MSNEYIHIPENETPRVFEKFVTEANDDLRKKISDYCGKEYELFNSQT